MIFYIFSKLFGKSASTNQQRTRLISEATKNSRTKVEIRPANQNLNQQQTLTYDQKYGLEQQQKRRPLSSSVSFGDNNSKVFDRLAISTNKSLDDSTGDVLRSYIRLPIHRSLIHDKAWSPGKVNTIYYPYRDLKLNRNH